MSDKYLKRLKLDCRILKSTKDMPKEEWLKLRKTGISGTDVAGILGISKYSSPIKVYIDKTSEEVEDIDNEYMYWGRQMEDLIKKEFSIRTGLKVQKVNAILQHQEHDWAIGNIDGLIMEEERGVLECKTVSQYGAGEWEDDEIPAHYLVQLQWYLFITGCSYGYFAALIGGNKFIYKRVEADKELHSLMLQAVNDFRNNHLIPEIMPELDGLEATTNYLKDLYPESNGQAIDLLNDADIYIEALQQIDSELKGLEGKKNEYQNKLKEMLGEAEKGTTSKYAVIWKSYEKNSVDSKLLQKEHPDIYEKCSKKSQCRKFSIK